MDIVRVLKDVMLLKVSGYGKRKKTCEVNGGKLRAWP